MATNKAPASEFKTDEVLFEQDAVASKMYVIQSGRVRLERRVFKETFVVEVLGPGHVVGEVAIAENARYPASAICDEATTAVVIERDKIEATLLSNADVLKKITQKLAVRIAHTTFRMSNLALRDTTARVMLQLRYEAIRSGALGGAAFAPLPFDLPQVVVSENGPVRAAVTELVREGLVELDGAGRFRIIDAPAYERKLTYLELATRFQF